MSVSDAISTSAVTRPNRALSEDIDFPDKSAIIDDVPGFLDHPGAPGLNHFPRIGQWNHIFELVSGHPRHIDFQGQAGAFIILDAHPYGSVTVNGEIGLDQGVRPIDLVAPPVAIHQKLALDFQSHLATLTERTGICNPAQEAGPHPPFGPYLNIGGRASTHSPSALPDCATANTAAIERKPSSARG